MNTMFQTITREQARSLVDSALERGLVGLSKDDFLTAYAALSFVFCYHPDDVDESSPLEILEFVSEAKRRVDAGEIDGDSDYYQSEAAWLVADRIRKGTYE